MTDGKQRGFSKYKCRNSDYKNEELDQQKQHTT